MGYLLFQQLNLNYAAVLFCLGLVWTLFGQIALNKAVKASGRNSYIILLIGLTVALSAIAMGYASSEHLTLLLKGEAESGGDICGFFYFLFFASCCHFVVLSLLLEIS